MIYISKIKIVLAVFLLACACMHVEAKKGDNCWNPIELYPGYSESVLTAGTTWYVANTFDLPLAIDFYPTNETADAPELYLDFGCTPGVYDDPILCSLFCSSNAGYISMPYKQIPDMDYDAQGKARYHVEFGQFYRDMLLAQGIDYNVQVYIRVVFSCGGALTMEPDAFNNCMDGHKFIHLGDTVQVKPLDKDRHVVVPYVQWQYDSIRYVWQGEKECVFAVGNKCGFDPTDKDDPVVIDRGVIQPGGVLKVSSELLMQYVSDQKNYPNDAGMYFAKFYSESDGVMKIEKIPAPAPGGDADLLKYGVTSIVYRNDTSRVYAMPSSWVKAMQFTTPTDRIFRMYIGKTPDFYTADAVATFQFDKTEDGHVLSLFESDMRAIWQNKAAGENFLYVRFECVDNTTVLPSLWTPSDCESKATRIEMGTQFEVTARSKTVYELYYEEIKNGDMTFAWTSNQAACPFYIADTCDVPNSATGRVFYADQVPKQGTFTCTQDVIVSWADYVDADGYLYIRFYSNAKAKITVTTTAPPEEDPVCNTFDTIITETAWDTYTWRGTTYTKSGTYLQEGTVDPETRCADSLFVLNLTIRNTVYQTLDLEGCDTIIYNAKIYTQSEEFVDTTYTSVGNRIIKTVRFSIGHSSQNELTASACNSYTAPWGTKYTESGDYRFTATNASGCDSVVVLHLTVGHSSWEELTEEAFDSYTAPWGTVYTTSGEYSHKETNMSGCDSITLLYLTIHQTLYDTVREHGCDSIMIGGVKYKESCDIVQDTTYLPGGDRVIHVLSVGVGHTAYNPVDKTVCGAYESPATGRVYTTSGKYVETYTDEYGCDSIVVLNLTVRTDCEDYDTVYFCEGMNTQHEEWNGAVMVRYEPYTYQSPAEWNYMEGVVLAGEQYRTLMDLNRAEQNLRNHYVGGLTPVQLVSWNLRYVGSETEMPIEVTENPQWINSGVLILRVYFLCGEIYHSDFTTDIHAISTTEQPRKTVENGQVVILRGGEKYSVLGVKIQ